MNLTPYLYVALRGLNNAMKGSLDGTKIESIKETINNYAIASAIASMAANVLPGVAGVVAALTQAGFVWATYVKINKTLGISMSENTAKFIGSAVLTNIVTCSGALLISYAGAAVLSFIPLWGQAAAAAIDGALGYIIIYTAATLYLELISEKIQPDGTLKMAANNDTEQFIKSFVKKSNIDDIIKEGRASYKKAKADGTLDRARRNPKCPNCGGDVKHDHKYCPNCGTALK